MKFSLSDEARSHGFRLDVHEVVESTNAVALEHAGRGEAGGLWVVSDAQSGGRGRRGRAWSTEKGNLAATLLVVNELDLKISATLGFVAGLALVGALETLAVGQRACGNEDAREPGFELKWPNDVLAHGRKISGILLESTIRSDGKIAIAVGIGVNVVSHPEGLPYPAGCLHALGMRCDAAEVFGALSESWRALISVWDEGRGLASLREQWLLRARGVGGEVSIRLGDRLVNGVFETIDDDCHLVIRTADAERVVVTAGDVHFGAAASARAV